MALDVTTSEFVFFKKLICVVNLCGKLTSSESCLAIYLPLEILSNLFSDFVSPIFFYFQ